MSTSDKAMMASGGMGMERGMMPYDYPFGMEDRMMNRWMDRMAMSMGMPMMGMNMGSTGMNMPMMGMKDWPPHMDIKETDNEYVMYAELPGVKKRRHKN